MEKKKFECNFCSVECRLEVPKYIKDPSTCPVGGLSMWQRKYDLAPCPFCGEQDSVVMRQSEENPEDNFTVNCDFNKDGCGAQSGYGRTEEAAKERWNKRG